MQIVGQHEPTEKSRCVIDLEAKILAEESAMTTDERNARFARLERESEKHGAFARIW